MHYVRFATGAGPAWGQRDPATDEVRRLSAAPWDAPEVGAGVGPSAALRLLAPCTPRRVVALAYNYTDLVVDPSARADGAADGGSGGFEEPLIFLKQPGSVIGPGEPIRLPAERGDVWVEVELAFVIGKTARDVAAEDAAAHIAGYTIGNDVTTENVHGRDWHLARSKALDTFCPTGPYLVPDFDGADVALGTEVSGKETQRSTTGRRIAGDAAALALVSRSMTLEPGDLVLTGTPAGARQSLVEPGDTVRCWIHGLGELSNSVV